MKKGSIFFWLVIVLLLVAVVSLYAIETTKKDQPPATIPTADHAEKDDPTSATEESKETPQKKQPFKTDSTERDNFLSVIEQNKETDSKTGLKKIPVYFEEELLFKTGGLFYLNRDACIYEGQSAMDNYTGSLLEAYPTSAIRGRDKDTIYFVYATDTGYRLYLFASYENELQTPVGFPVLIEKLLSYTDFKNIAVGDKIEEVEAIDPVTSLHKKQIVEIWDLAPVAARKLAEKGYPCTTIHYLKDGILKIEYEMLEDQSLVVSNVVFSKDYQIESANGKVVNYKIEALDLPTN